MILVWLILIPFITGLIVWIFGRDNHDFIRWASLAAMAADMILALVLWAQYLGQVNFLEQGNWLVQYKAQWIPQLGISLHLAVDGLSLLMVLLTAFLGMISVITSWTEIQERVGLFHFNLLWVLAGITGVFLSLDLFLFYFFWEMMLVPMYFLIGIWGHENRIYASIKFFLFTQASGLLMLLAILGLYFVHFQDTGILTFNYLDLLGTPMAKSVAVWLMLGFFVAFAVKIPAFPFHTWLPDAHTEAPTAGSVILAGLLLKTGAYGLLRFVLPLFPGASIGFAPVAMIAGVIGILYGAIQAFGQNDLKRLVAYTSVSHLGFVLLGIYSFNEFAIQGAIIQMICHGLSTGALFVLVGNLQEQIHTRDMDRMGGMWESVPRMGGVAMFFALASLGLPGMGNFVGEFLVLIGTYFVNIPLAVIASVGMVAATVYSLWMIQRTFHGEKREEFKLPDLTPRVMVMMFAMMGLLLWLGLYPSPVLNTARPAIHYIQQPVNSALISEGKIKIESTSDTERLPVDPKVQSAGEEI